MEIFDIQSVDPEYKNEILTTQIAGAQSVFLQVFTPSPVAALSGKMPILPTEYTMGSDHDPEGSRVALDDVAKGSKMSLNDVSYRFEKKYARKGGIHRAQVEQLNAQGAMSATDVLALTYLQPMIQIASDIDKDGLAVLNGVSNTVPATAVWSNDSTARPITDLDALIFNTVPGADILWLGFNEYLELAKLPALKALVHGFDGVDATITREQMAAYLRQRYQLTDVIIGGGWYNEEAAPVTISKKRRFDGLVFAGMRDHIVTVEFAALRESWEKYDPDSQTYQAGLNIYSDQVFSGEPDAGARLTGF